MIRVVLFWVSFFNFVILSPAQARLLPAERDQLLICYKHLMEKESGNKKFDRAMKSVNKDNFHHLIIDKLRLENPSFLESKLRPHLIFDHQSPGYYKSMKQAFKWMSEQIGKPVDLKLLIQLHDRAVDQVLCEDTQKIIQKGISRNQPNYGLDPAVLDPRAIDELLLGSIVFSPSLILKRMAPQNSFTHLERNELTALTEGISPSPVAQLYEIGFKWPRVVSLLAGDGTEAAKRLQPMLDYYYEKVGVLKTLSGKLEAIAELLRTLEVAHLFSDGNQRTYAFLLLPKLLIENNIPLAVLEWPYMFDGYYTVGKMAIFLREGIENFLNLNETYHRSLLKTETCQRVQDLEDVVYLLETEDEYTPYFAKVNLKADVFLRERFQATVAKAIEDKNLHHQEIEEDLIKRAVFYDDRESIEALVENGQNPFVLEGSSLAGPFNLAMKLKNYELAQFLIDLTRPEHVDLTQITARLDRVQAANDRILLRKLLELLAQKYSH